MTIGIGTSVTEWAENNRASRSALIPPFRYSNFGSERQNAEPWSQMALIPAKSGETTNIATRWSKSTHSRLPPNTGTNIRLRRGALPQRSPRFAPIWTRTFFLNWVTRRYSTSRYCQLVGRRAAEHAVREDS